MNARECAEAARAAWPRQFRARAAGVRALARMLLTAVLAAPLMVQAATFNVNTTADLVDAVPGNGACATAGGTCSLRAAVQEANALAGADIINLPAGNYVLNRGSGDDSATGGDLDINQSLTITGAGARTTTVNGNGLDRVFHIRNSATVNISSLAITNGNAGGNNGGGLLIEATATLTDVSITASNAKDGAGISNDGTVTLNNVTLSGNIGTGNGGGLQSGGSSPLNFLTNVTISGNSAAGDGGGAETDHVVMTNVTITGNTAGDGAGYNKRGGQAATLSNTIIANNIGPRECKGTPTSLGYNIDSDNTCSFSGPGDLPATAAGLGPLQNNGGDTDTHAILFGSAAIDAGTNTGCPATDQRGTVRPIDGNGDATATCDIGAYELDAHALSGRVFEDANFAGTASAWDGGAADLGLANVDVELYDAGTDAYLGSTTTAAGGSFSFSGLANGSYKVRVRSATIGDADTPPRGGLNASVPATWPYPLAELAWGNGAALYGGQSAIIDDTSTGDNAGPGDTFVTLAVSGADVNGVDFGFAYNLIVNTNDDGNANATRSTQGSLRQFIKNANATGTAGGTTANASQFRMQVAANQSNGGDAWWRIAPVASLPLLADGGTVLNGATQRTNSGTDSNTRGPEIELHGAAAGGGVNGLTLTTGSSTVRELAVNGFTADGIAITGGSTHLIAGNYIGTNAIGTAGLANGDDGVDIKNSPGNLIGGTTAADRNVIAGQTGDGIYLEGTATTGNLIRGNWLGVNATNTGPIANGANGIRMWSPVLPGPANNRIGGSSPADSNIIANSGGPGVLLQAAAGTGNSIFGNAIHTNAGLGIELEPVGSTPNDAGDVDTGPNDLINFPEITSASVLTGTVTARFDLDLQAGSYRIEFFKNPSGADPSGNGEGEIFADAVTITHPGGGYRSFTHTFAGALGDVLSATTTLCTDGATCNAFGNTSEFSGNATVVAPQADLELALTDNPDPAPAGGELLYTAVITNNGPDDATSVVLTDVLPASVTLVSATPSQGSCSGTTTVTCSFGSILNGGTASVEILVVTGGAGSITNNVNVAAAEADSVPANNAASEGTTVVVGGTTDIPLTQYRRLHGFIDYTTTGGTLRTQPNSGDACLVGASSTATLSGIPATATVNSAYLYWAGSGSTIDNQVSLDAAALTADRTWTSRFVLGANNYDFFGGFEDVTAYVQGKGNGNYTFSGLAVDTGNPYCSVQAVLAGWALIVVYEDTSLTGKTLVVYDGFDITRNGSSAYVLAGIYASPPPEGKTTALLWEGDETLGGANESLAFNGSALSDGMNPVDNVYNSTINTLGASTTYGTDLDTFDVSGVIAARDTLATMTVDTGPDLVILNAVVLAVKSNVIVGTVFEDVNYGGGAGRDLATAVAAAPAFTVPRPNATVELYDAAGTYLRSTTTDASGEYGFAGLVDGNYTVRVVNDSVTSSRPGAVASLRAVQTFRTDGSGGAVVAVTDEVGGASPSDQDAPANLTSANLSSFTAQSTAPVQIVTGVTVAGVDFGFNFDTVVNTNDAGQGSLRQVLTNANTLGNAGLAQAGRPAGIENAIFMLADGTARPGLTASYPSQFTAGIATIAPVTVLPAVADPLILDAQTQPGWSAAPIVEVDGSGLPAGLSGLSITAGNSTVRGFVINRFVADTNNGGIRIAGAGSNTVQGNYLGTTAAGTAAAPNYQGVIVDNSPGNLIGGTTATERNVVSGNTLRGIRIVGAAATGNTVSGNYVGLNAAGTAAVAQPIGIYLINTPGNTVGGTAPQAGNVVSGNSQIGIYLVNAGTTGNLVQGNTVGLNYNASAPVPNGTYGIEVTTDAAGNTIGGAAAGAQNLIANNGADGIRIASGLGNVISRNSIYANAGIGINLGVDAVTLNDSGDGDAGGNALLNYPVTTYAAIEGANLTVAGFARPDALVEFFIAELDATGFGEGKTYLFSALEGSGADLDAGAGSYGPGAVSGLSQGADTTNRFRFTVPLPPGVTTGTALTATATDSAGNTSEFGGRQLVSQPQIVKRAFFADGTPIPTGTTLNPGRTFQFMLYINNPGGAVSDVSLVDLLDPAFAYQAGSIRYDNSVSACAAAVCTPAEEAAIHAAVAAGVSGSDAVDGDVVSYSAATLRAGNQGVANAQLDIAADRVWALLFTVRMQ